MPESRRRKPKKIEYVPPTVNAARTRKRSTAPSAPWVGALLVGLFVLGIAWLLVYYFSSGGVIGMRALGDWNLLVGFGFIVGGLVVATQWK